MRVFASAIANSSGQMTNHVVSYPDGSLPHRAPAGDDEFRVGGKESKSNGKTYPVILEKLVDDLHGQRIACFDVCHMEYECYEHARLLASWNDRRVA